MGLNIRLAIIIVSFFTILSNASWTALSYYISQDAPLSSQNGHLLGMYSLLYSVCALIAGAIGLFGALKSHSEAIATFSNFLLLDGVISCILRFTTLFTVTSWARDVLCRLDLASSTPIFRDIFSDASKLGQMMVMVPSNNPTVAAEEGCWGTIVLLSSGVGMGMFAAALIQLFFVLSVRKYTQGLRASARRNVMFMGEMICMDGPNRL